MHKASFLNIDFKIIIAYTCSRLNLKSSEKSYNMRREPEPGNWNGGGTEKEKKKKKSPSTAAIS